MTKPAYLLVEETIPYSPKLGMLLGVCAALILQQTFYWCCKNREKKSNFRDGFYWTYGTYKDWEGWLCGFNERTIRRNISMLVDRGLLVVGRYNAKAFDKTNWYRVDEVKVQMLISSSVHSVPTDWPICPDGEANLSTPIPETKEETTEDISFASPTTKTQTHEDEMLPKNPTKKGPTSSASVVSDILAPPSVKKDAMVMSLYKVWATHLPRNHESIKFVGEFSVKKKGLMAQCGRLWKDQAGDVLLYVIENWVRFGKFVNDQAGSKFSPAVPSLEFLVKHRELAINFFLNKAMAKDGSVQLTALENSPQIIKKMGKIVLKKGGYVEPLPLAVNPPPEVVPVVNLAVDAEEDDEPVTLEFLLQEKYGKTYGKP